MYYFSEKIGSRKQIHIYIYIIDKYIKLPYIYIYIYIYIGTKIGLYSFRRKVNETCHCPSICHCIYYFRHCPHLSDIKSLSKGKIQLFFFC